jgi:hypothetical protein
VVEGGGVGVGGDDDKQDHCAHILIHNNPRQVDELRGEGGGRRGRKSASRSCCGTRQSTRTTPNLWKER